MELLTYSVGEARSSSKSLLPELFAYVDYRLIGTHENTREANTNAVYKAIKDNGYEGPALSVFYVGDDIKLKDLRPNSQIEIEYGVVGIADGHNRLEALRLLDEQGLLRSRFIPVQVIPAHDSKIVRISTRVASDPALAIYEVEWHFAKPNSVIATINSYFEAKLKDGRWVPLREAQPNIIIPRESFIRSTIS